jgi:hypothetical protein
MEPELEANGIQGASSQEPINLLNQGQTFVKLNGSLRSKIRRKSLFNQTLTMGPDERPQPSRFHWEWLWS